MTDAVVLQRSWIWGGALLIASAVLQLASSGVLTGLDGAQLVTVWTGRLALAAALVLFAFGWRGTGSVVARSTPGVVALMILAFWPLVGGIVFGLLPADEGLDDLFVTLGYIDLVVWLGAALVAVTAIGRAEVVPARWRWAPAWGLAVVAGLGALTQIVGVAFGSDGLVLAMPLLGLLGLATILVPLLLGILAIVLGATARPREAVQVYPPAA